VNVLRHVDEGQQVEAVPLDGSAHALRQEPFPVVIVQQGELVIRRER
jgi:hypothetical protein